MVLAPFAILRMTWTEWSSNSSVAGAGNIGNAKDAIRKVLWIILFIGGLFLTVKSTVDVLESYRAYNVNTAITLSQQSSVRN